MDCMLWSLWTTMTTKEVMVGRAASSPPPGQDTTTGSTKWRPPSCRPTSTGGRG